MLDAIGFVPDSTTAIEPQAAEVASEFALLGNYPNPFNPSTTIQFSLDKPGLVILSIYNIRGQLVDRVKQNYTNSGYQQIFWKAASINKKTLSSGIYLYKLEHDSDSLFGKMLLSK